MRCDRRGHLIMVGDAVGEATREAPARTEPRTVRAGASRVALTCDVNPEKSGEVHWQPRTYA